MEVKASQHVEEIPRAEPSARLLRGQEIDVIAAAESTQTEHDLDFKTAIKLYPKAVGWSFFFSLGVIMLSFDPQLLGNLYATPAFQKAFGYEFNGSYIISAPWQTALSMGNPIGQVFGALFAGLPMEWYGRKKTFSCCVVGTGCLIFIQFFARSLSVLLVGELIGGLVLGMYVVIAPAYASEVCPLALRGMLTSYVNLCFVIGQLLANGVTAGTSQRNDHWAYSIPFALQWFWVIIILPGMAFAPESPWWLARKGRLEEAENSLRRLAASSVDVKATLAQLVKTDCLEQELEAGSTYTDVFRPVNWRRTEIAIGVYAIQVLCGVYMINYGTYFFQLAGLPTGQAFNMGVGFLAVGFLGTVLSWVLLRHIGRRPIYNSGLTVLAILQVLVGILDCIPGYESKKGVIWAQSSLLVIWNFIYDLTVGPVAYVIFCECSATRVRSKTIAVATAAQAILGIIMTVAIPYMINPDQADLRGKVGFFFGGLATLSLVWSFLRVPETSGRTYEELNIMFQRNVPTRDFGTYDLTSEAEDQSAI
ncbi:MAG: hypothetical protein M1821_007743 [Bathelium mastoideum]|nr:MAG: hypothetical protein M1821_007743 [Bathelium mastoideum]